MSDFITTSDLAAFLQRDDIDQTLGAMVCAMASESVRNRTGSQLNIVEDDSVFLDGSGTDVLMLPELPVRSIVAVLVDSVEVSDYALGAAGLLYRTPGSVWPSGPLRVQVVYDHGFANIPEDVRQVTLLLAARLYAIGGLPDDSSPIALLLPLERDTLDRYRDRGYRPPVWRQPTDESSSSSSGS